MMIDLKACETQSDALYRDNTWMELYPRLHSLARRFVYKYRIPCWYGQEEEIAEDVSQETVRRLIEHARKAARGEVQPINRIEHMVAVVALNYIRDMIRHERRIVQMREDNEALEMNTGINMDQLNMPEIAIENVYRQQLFLSVAHEVAILPYKQRKALLIDLANRMCFDTHPTPLQAAFLAVDIDLQDYQQSLPTDPTQRGRHASLLSYVYKRLAQIDFL